MDALNKAFILLALCLLAAPPALSQEMNEAPQKPQGYIVTSVKSCMDQLDPADAADIRANYMQPWQECQKRLATKREEEKMEKVKALTEGKEKEPETPRNYIRVKKIEDKAEEKTENKTSKEAAEEAKTSEDKKTK
jgi:hypothetical protein